ncbi:unnamed protein product [Laminaria digitata]
MENLIDEEEHILQPRSILEIQVPVSPQKTGRGRMLQGQKDRDDDGVNGKDFTHFNVNFKSRFKMTQETIPFERYAFQKGITGKYTITIPYLGSQLVLKIKGKVPREFSDRNDTSSVRKGIKITRTRLGEYYANVTFEVQQTCKFQSDKGDMISFDPGSKTFLTYHSPDGTWGAIGSFKNQETLLRKADGLRRTCTLRFARGFLQGDTLTPI